MTASCSIRGNGNVAGNNGLVNTYRTAAATGTEGQRTFQVIRVPMYLTATLSSSLTAARWDGDTGGVLAFEVAGLLTLGGSTVSLDGRGLPWRGRTRAGRRHHRHVGDGLRQHDHQHRARRQG